MPMSKTIPPPLPKKYDDANKEIKRNPCWVAQIWG